MTERRTDDALRTNEAAWRRAYLAALPRAAGGCPSDERLAALALGEVSGDERAGLADHVVACRRCAESLRTLRALHGAAPPQDRWRWGGGTRRRLLAGAAAAVVAVVVIVALFQLAPAPPDDGRFRGAAVAAPETEPADGARLAAPPKRLAWKRLGGPAADDVRHRVVLYDAESIPLWRSEPTGEGAVELPAEVRRRLLPGVYYWRIHTADGLESSATPLFRFEIVP